MEQLTTERLLEIHENIERDVEWAKNNIKEDEILKNEGKEEIIRDILNYYKINDKPLTPKEMQNIDWKYVCIHYLETIKNTIEKLNNEKDYTKANQYQHFFDESVQIIRELQDKKLNIKEGKYYDDLQRM